MPNQDISTIDWSYSPSLESLTPAINNEYGLFINGKFVPPTSGHYLKSINPTNGQKITNISIGENTDIKKAVKAAQEAGRRWRRTSGSVRSRFLFAIARRIQERSREFAVLETLDSGKTIRESRDFDIPMSAHHFFYYAGWADKLNWAFGCQTKPIGVCAQIIPWNFPLLMAAWKIAPALACGNTCILKPAETTSLTALRLAEIFQEVDLPKGVVNIITGDGKTGEALTKAEGINKIAFTGSTTVGKKIAHTASKNDLKITLELGGKSANIIMADASIDQAIEGVVSGIWFNQGQVCCAGSRLFVEESILSDVIYRLKHRMHNLKIGNPLDKNTDIGPINSKEQLIKIQNAIETGCQEGSVLHECFNDNIPEKGWWQTPCFFTDVQPSQWIAREEIFGPVLSIMTFRTPEEVLQKANHSPYGLSAGIWSEKGSKIFGLASKLEAGVIWCNTYNKFDPASPFGGFKESGFGREGGIHGLREYVRIEGNY